MQTGLQCKLGFALKSGDLALRERIALGRIECLDKRPLDAGEIERKTVTAAGVFGMRGEPRRKFRSQVAQRKGAAGMLGEIGDAERFKAPLANQSAQRGKIFSQCARARETNIAGCRFQGARRP